MKVNYKYLGVGLIIFLVEIFIALKVDDQIIRPYIGDVLVVILIYVVIKGVTSKPTKKLPIYIFIFTVVVEISQLFNIGSLLGLTGNKVVMVLLGSTFDIKDIIMYGVGALLLLEWERLLRKDISYL